MPAQPYPLQRGAAGSSGPVNARTAGLPAFAPEPPLRPVPRTHYWSDARRLSYPEPGPPHLWAGGLLGRFEPARPGLPPITEPPRGLVPVASSAPLPTGDDLPLLVRQDTI